MRRLPTILMIAALLAVLVPSAASAGKPVPSIDTLVVRSGGAVPGTNDCYVDVVVDFQGYAPRVEIMQRNYLDSMPWSVRAHKKTGSADLRYTLSPDALVGPGKPLQWEAVMAKPNGTPRSDSVHTNTILWPDGPCPTSGTVLASTPPV